ncbi:MAG: hypothetical protein IKV25_07260 [Clostridia bacterium]|nr:hypothetical protein [Clostridia bacterium]
MKAETISLKELGREYERNAQLQQFFIDKCKADIKRAKESGDLDAVRQLQSNLNKFYEIKNELSQTADQLKNYYKGEN